jgi:hypothetical protein
LAEITVENWGKLIKRNVDGGCFYYFLVAGALLFGWNLDNSFECVLVVNMMELCGCYQCCEGSHINVNLMVSITSIKISISNPYKKP